MRKVIHWLLVGCVFLLMSLPLMLSFADIKDIVRPLEGNYEKAARPYLTGRSWLKGSYQLSMEKYFSDHLSGRDFLIRLFNSFRFFCFRYVIAEGVTVGKSNVLYQQMYIDALVGRDLVNQPDVEQDAVRLKAVQDSLKKYNKLLIFLVAPGKASMYPEFLPDSIPDHSNTESNYERYSSAWRKTGCEILDMNAWLHRLKSKVHYPIFPKNGTHWSGHLIPLIMDTISQYISANSEFQLNKFSVKPGVETTVDLRYTDNDIGEKLNLLVGPKQWPLTYPAVTFSKSVTGKPRLLSIGDSFTQSFWGFYPFFDDLFGDSTVFWYYNRLIGWPDELQRQYIDVKTLDLYSEVMSRDIILVVTTEQNLKTFSFNFINEFYPYVQYGLYRFNQDRAAMMHRISHTPEWLATVSKKSEESGIPRERMIRMDAEWVLFHP